MNGVILHHRQLPDLKDIRLYRPDIIVLDIEKPNDMIVLEKFSKSELALFPMFTIGTKANILENMIDQATKVLSSNTIFLRANQKASSEARRYIQDLVHRLKNKTYQIFVMAPASHFLEHNTCATILLEDINNAGIEIHPSFMLSGTKQSMSILEDDRFLRLLDLDPLAEFAILPLFSDDLDLEYILEFERNVLFFGMRGFIWFRENTIRKSNTIEYLPSQIIALAKIIRDRESVWSDPKLSVRVTRKLFVGQPDLQIVEFLSENVGKTVEGDFIKLANFSVEHL